MSELRVNTKYDVLAYALLYSTGLSQPAELSGPFFQNVVFLKLYIHLSFNYEI